MDNSEKIILDLCSGTGAWSDLYAQAGYNRKNFDLSKGIDVRLLHKQEWSIWGILAAPPCTEFSFAKHFHGKGNYKHNFKEGLSIVDACLRAVVLYKPQWWVLENPKGYLRWFLGEPSYVFDPWQYGDNYQKKTCLWGDFNMPPPIILEKPDNIIKFSMLKSKDIAPEQYGKLSRQKRRAITPPGFAKAFFEANP